MKNIIQPVKGTREFYPEEMALRNYLFEKIRAVIFPRFSGQD